MCLNIIDFYDLMVLIVFRVCIEPCQCEREGYSCLARQPFLVTVRAKCVS
jgi:hypothetical protein